MSAENFQNDQIAIIGMACRMPGGVNSPSELWRLLVDKHDPVREGPFDRWDVDAFYDPAREVPGRSTTKWAATLDNITDFDAAFFGISPAEAASLDPQHRLLLEASWEALEYAGIPPRSVMGTRGGVFVGIWSADNSVRLGAHYDQLDAYAATTGNTHSTAAGRVSYVLGLHGPSLAIDTACSSSLVATHVAVQSLRSGESDFALAGGVNVMLRPEFMVSGSRFGMFSPTGRCHAFDARGDGLVRGEGVGMIVLKRLSDAERDGDRVLAIIRGSAINQDGRSHGLVAPSEDAQLAVYREAVEQAGIDPGQVGLVETHGPGTPVGDPIEFRALTPVYGSGSGRCALGSVKSNIGHLESASGIAGLIKTVLALEHAVVPPNLHFERWNPDISPEATRFFVPTESTPWPVESPTKLAAVSSFGFSGTNAHLILEAPPQPTARTHAKRTPGQGSVVVPLSAGSVEVLAEAATRTARWLTDENPCLDDIVHTLGTRRSHHKARLAVVAATVPELVDRLHTFAGDEPQESVSSGSATDAAAAGAVWVFSGQGSQWTGMGARLLDEEPAFAETVAELEPLIQAEAGFSLTATLRAADLVSEIDRLQLTLFSTQVALAAVWRFYGLEPAAVIGHSMGEVSAAVVSGALSLRDGVRASYRRAGQLVPLSGTGAMASVDLPCEQVEQELQQVSGVTVGVISSPRATVVTGDPAPVRQLVETWQQRGHLARFIASDVASHGPHLDPYAGQLSVELADLDPREPAVPFYSTVTEDPREKPSLNGAYWADNLRKPVRFAHAVRAAAEDGYRVFLEISVHPITGYAMRDTLREIDDSAVVAHTIRREAGDHDTIMSQLARLYCAGVPVDFRGRNASGALVDLPATTWNRQRHWIDVPLAHPGKRNPAGAIAHPLLGSHTRVPDTEGKHLWQADLGTTVVPWLAEHQVEGVTVLPGAVFCELALGAGATAFDCAAQEVELTRMRFRQLLPLDEHTTVYTSLVPRGEHTARVEVLTAGEGADEWVTHASAELRRQARIRPPKRVSVDALSEAHPEETDIESYYGMLRAEGYHHGPAFTGLRSLHKGTGHAVFARVEVPPAARTLAGPVGLHPVLLDAGLQALLASVVAPDGGDGSRLFFPVEVGSLRLFGNTADSVFCQATPLSNSAEGLTGTLRLLAEDGTVLAEADDVRFSPLDGWLATSRVERLFHEIRWAPAELTKPPAARGQWCVLGMADDPLVSALHAELAHSGVQVSVLRPPTSVAEEAELAVAAESVTDVVLLAQSAASVLPDECRGGVMRAARVTRSLGESVRPPRLWLVTRGARALGSEDVALAAGGLRGLARVAMCEYPKLRTALIDLDPADATAKELAQELFADGAEDEIVWREGRRWAARLVNKPVSGTTWATRPQRNLRYGQDGIAVDIARRGDLDTLGQVARPRREPAAGEIEIQPTAIGLNFADVMNMLNLFGDRRTTSGRLGLECAGRVVRVGDGVSQLQIGDRVMAFHDGTASTFVTLPAELAVRVPEAFTDVEAAALPAAYLTAWYALTRVGRLCAGERILIHAGSGGVGLAAIGVAKALGARVLATAGSERKRAYLRDLGVECVMDSRSHDFVAQTLEATGGQGVDVVLNSLSGQKLFAGLDVLGIGGRFVEIGKRDINADAKLGMRAFRRNIAVASVDLALLARERSHLVAELLRELRDELASGHLKVLPCTEFEFTQAADAIRHMAAAKHIGKLVLTVPQEGETVVAVPPGVHPTVRSGGGYVITGGLGGLGLELTRWLAERGAGKIVLNGRSAPSEAASGVLAEVRATGTEVEVITGDIAELGVAGRLVAAATADRRRLCGVLHAAAVLDDGALTNLDESRLGTVWEPKVTGAWRLHEATEGHDLDWFVLFSSMASMLGSPGQGNYAAANDWLDSFARWRQAKGLPGLAVSWGAWGQAGRATELGQRGYATFSTADGLAALDRLLDHDRANAGVFSYDPHHWFQATPMVARCSLFSELHTEPEGDTEPGSEILARLRGSSRTAQSKLVANYLAELIRVILGLGNGSVDTTSPLPDLGFDSLSALQLRNRLETDLAVKIPATVVWTHPTPASLGEYLLSRLEPASATADDPRSGPAVVESVNRSWFRTFAPRPQAVTRLYCFPHAGGAASTYRRWSTQSPEHVQLCALQLPGREDRAEETSPRDLVTLAEELAAVIAEDPGPGPFGFFGHSGGSLLAFETARALRRRGARAPVVLGLSAMVPPSRAGTATLSGKLFQIETPEALEALADIPADVRADPHMFERAQRALRADHALYLGYPHEAADGWLDCPIIAFGGDDDPLVDVAELAGWSTQTTAKTETRIYDGDHFYLRHHIPAIVAELVARL